jgi:hypothetical protein
MEARAHGVIVYSRAIKPLSVGGAHHEAPFDKALESPLRGLIELIGQFQASKASVEHQSRRNPRPPRDFGHPRDQAVYCRSVGVAVKQFYNMFRPLSKNCIVEDELQYSKALSAGLWLSPPPPHLSTY